ncbi:hypothetical protein HII36_33245 [Nonomuraea sp. NN258]|uniref:hypothetical protein n=1 Tax=Nonomuraea antri TaxID=2730852 RepID=UPI0015697085|nr:hypothetical protein [Nonomuraea antri]NRQ36665.1 hypothetical protein [Nonomuraea antri]
MTMLPPLIALLAGLVMVTSCSAATPRDQRPLGSVTAVPQVCGLISKDAIGRATGLTRFSASGSEPGGPFKLCSVIEEPDQGEGSRLLIEIYEPPPTSLQGLENTKAHDNGSELPEGLGPGYSALIQRDGEVVGAYVYAWTPDVRRLLSIRITHGAPGRDHRADAIEFLRQLKPLLLAPSRLSPVPAK